MIPKACPRGCVWEKEWRNSAVFRNWHASCNVLGIQRMTHWNGELEDFEMSEQVSFSQRIGAMFGAIAISALMVAVYFSPAASASLGGIA